MRDLHLRQTLTSLARDASKTLAGLVEAGQEIPYEIGEPGEGFAFCQYQPLTARFVRDNAAALRELPSFAEATATMIQGDLAGPYLEEAGLTPPADPAERATLAVTYFLARLWDGAAEFTIEGDRLAAALGEIEECAEPEEGEVEAIVPLVGLQMPVTRLDLAGAAIVRADAVDVPAEAGRAERPSGAAWEPTFLISARVSLDEDGGLGGAGERVARTFERVVTTLRLHKSGGVGLAPHGWVRVAGDRWRRIATGAGRPRPGGYRLSEAELSDVTDLARVVAVHPRRVARLRRALLRFESGLDRRGAIDALNDHLLALRFMLEGEGPAGVGLPMRVAALAGPEFDRGDAKNVVERAIALERELWSGEPVSAATAGPSEIAAEIEGLLRAILRRSVTGDLGSDLRAAADEALLADGLAIGDGAGQRGSDTEWDLEVATVEIPAEDEGRSDEPEREEALMNVNEEPEDFDIPDAEMIRVSRPERAWTIEEDEPAPVAQAGPVSDSAAEPAPRIEDVPTMPFAFAEEEEPEDQSGFGRRATTADWLEEAGGEATMDFPARSAHLDELSRPPMDREEVKARVEYLFPRTETDWTVGKGPRRAAS